MPRFTGIDAPCESPSSADLNLDTSKLHTRTSLDQAIAEASAPLYEGYCAENEFDLSLYEHCRRRFSVLAGS